MHVLDLWVNEKRRGRIEFEEREHRLHFISRNSCEGEELTSTTRFVQQLDENRIYLYNTDRYYFASSRIRDQITHLVVLPFITFTRAWISFRKFPRVIISRIERRSEMEYKTRAFFAFNISDRGTKTCFVGMDAFYGRWYSRATCAGIAS